MATRAAASYRDATDPLTGPTMIPVLTIPGIGGSGPGHWQTRWERRQPGVSRVAQRDWDRPELDAWLGALAAAVAAAPAPPILAAHSLGCLLVAHWLARGGLGARAALWVAVPDPAGPAFPAAAAGFGPLPAAVPSIPITVVSSRDDPYGSAVFAAGVATAWRAAHVDAGAAGHLNADSGLGDWPAGWALLDGWRQAGD